MRILICSHEFLPYRGGIAVYTHEIASAAAALGHDVIVMAPDYDGDNSEQDSTRKYKTERFRGGRFSSRNLPGFLLLCRRIVRNSGSYDVIHAADKAFVVGLSFFRKKIIPPFLATIYGTDVLGYRKSRIVKLLRLRHLYTFPDRLFPISRYTQRILMESDPLIPENKVFTVPLSVNDEWFDPPENLPDDPDIPAGKKIVLTVGRLDRRKGHLAVMKALDKLPEKIREEICYVIVGGRVKGEEDYEREIDRLAGNGGISVVKKGVVSDSYLKWIYGRARVFCMTPEPATDRVEGFGMVYLEAASQKLPSIAANIGGVPEVVLHEKTGLVVESGDTEQLSEYLRSVLEDDRLRNRLGEAAYDYSRTFSWRKTARSTYEGLEKQP